MAIKTKEKTIHVFYNDKAYEHGKFYRAFSSLGDALVGISNRKVEFILVGFKRYNRKEFIKLCEVNNV